MHSVNQRDVYLINPTNSNLDVDSQHLFIVLSSNESFQNEGTFIGVMISSSEKTIDDHSFHLSDEMFDRPLDRKNSHVRCHLVTLFRDRHLVGQQKMNVMKPFHFRRLMTFLGEMIFNYDFRPLS